MISLIDYSVKVEVKSNYRFEKQSVYTETNLHMYCEHIQI
jgi:hypothetical protein